MSRPEPLESDVMRPTAGILVGILIAVPTAPLVWVFVDRLFHSGDHPVEIGATIVQLLIAMAFPAFGVALATWRHRISVDTEKRTVMWTKRVFGLKWASETWQASDIEAIAVVDARSWRSPLDFFAIYLVGPRGHRPMRELSVDASDLEAARAWALELEVAFRDERPSSRAPTTFVPADKGRFLPGLLLVALTLPALFVMILGEESLEYGIAFTALWILVLLLIRYTESVPTEEKKPVAYTPSRFDFLGAIWLLSIPFGPLIGWTATEQLTAGNWQIVAGTRAFLCVLLPMICVLPLLRFIRGRHAVACVIILSVGTAFPMLTGLGSAFDVVYGPVWQDVDVEAVRAEGKALRSGSSVNIPDARVDLADGRTVRPVVSAPVHRGPMRVLVLRGLNRIIDARE